MFPSSGRFPHSGCTDLTFPPTRRGKREREKREREREERERSLRHAGGNVVPSFRKQTMFGLFVGASLAVSDKPVEVGWHDIKLMPVLLAFLVVVFLLGLFILPDYLCWRRRVRMLPKVTAHHIQFTTIENAESVSTAIRPVLSLCCFAVSPGPISRTASEDR